MQWEKRDSALEAVKELKQKGVKIIAVEQSPLATNYSLLTPNFPIAIVAGHETTGISKKVLKREINPYLFRHSAATLLYNDDSIKEDDAARQMGHSKNMKNVYTHLNDNELKRRARKIYIKEENLPPEKKHELELKVENSNKKIDTLLDYVKVTHHILIDGIIKLKEKSKTKEELEELNELENKLDMIRIVNLK